MGGTFVWCWYETYWVLAVTLGCWDLSVPVGLGQNFCFLGGRRDLRNARYGDDPCEWQSRNTPGSGQLPFRNGVSVVRKIGVLCSWRRTLKSLRSEARSLIGKYADACRDRN